MRVCLAFLCAFLCVSASAEDGPAQMMYNFSVACPDEYSQGFYVNWYGERRCLNSDGNWTAPVDSGVLLTASFQCPRDLYTANVFLSPYSGNAEIQCATGSGFQQGVGSLIRQPSTLKLYEAGVAFACVAAFLVSVAVGFAVAGKPRGGVLD